MNKSLVGGCSILEAGGRRRSEIIEAGGTVDFVLMDYVMVHISGPDRGGAEDDGRVGVPHLKCTHLKYL